MGSSEGSPRTDADAATPRQVPESPHSADMPKPTPRQQPSQSSYSERLYVAWWFWPLPLLAAGLLAAEVHMGYPGVRAWLPYVIGFALAIGALLWLGKTKLAVTDGELWVGDAHIPLNQLGQVDVCSGTQKRKALGPELDPAAFVVHHAWIGPVLRVEVLDEQDPTPYWVFSTRSPDKLAKLITGSDSPG